MKLSIFDAIIATSSSGAELLDERAFRRSTNSILKGAALISQVFERNPELKKIAEANRLAFIVGSSVGEIEVTCDFLKELALTNTARPFLFQLSSHNSTLGFLAQHFSIAGPSLTMSNSYQTAEAALEAASLFLEAGHCDAALVFCVDQVISEWTDLKMYQASPGLSPRSGASLLLVGRDQKIEGLSARACLRDLTYNQKTSEVIESGAFYDSDTLEHIANRVEEKFSGRVSLLRPDSTRTEFFLDAST